MKKILLLIPLLLTACTQGEEITCNINGKNAVFTLKNGIITKYELNEKEMSKSTIDEINGEYFTSATNNEEGRKVLEQYVQNKGGNCN